MEVKAKVEITLEKGIGLEESWLAMETCSKVITIMKVLLTFNLGERWNRTKKAEKPEEFD